MWHLWCLRNPKVTVFDKPRHLTDQKHENYLPWMHTRVAQFICMIVLKWVWALIMTSKDVWIALAVRLYIFIVIPVKAFRFVCPMLSPCESTESEQTEDTPTNKTKQKMLTRLVLLAFDVTRVSRRSRRSEPHMQHGEHLCCVQLWDKINLKVKHKTFTFP